MAEYALRDVQKPIGVASYTTMLVEALPKNLKGSLPSIQEIEAEFEKHDIINKLRKNRMKERRKKV